MSRVFLIIALSGIANSREAGAAELRTGDVLRVRLLQTICSATSRVGDIVHASVVGLIDRDDSGLSGANLVGSVTKAHAVGLGIRRSRASLAIEFTALGFTQEAMAAFSGQLKSVDSARESVDESGTIRGIDAGNAARNRITSRLLRLPSLNPYPDIALLTFKLAAPFFPEPEIHYPQGTELLVMATAPATLAGGNRWKRDTDIPDWAARVLADGIEPRTLAGRKGKPADVINALLAGTSEDIALAFEKAGWNRADPNGPRAVVRSIFSVIEDRPYTNAPMSVQWYLGKKPAMMWQRVLNSAHKRHHVRVWRIGAQEEVPIWAVSATEDIAVGFKWRSFRVFHRIDPNIDIERRKLVSDLEATGCVESVSNSDRPEIPTRMINATGDEMFTDGRIALLAIGACASAAQQRDAGRHRNHGTVLSRKARKLILSLRNDIVRANSIVGVYDAGRTVWFALRPKRAPRYASILCPTGMGCVKEGDCTSSTPPAPGRVTAKSRDDR